MANRMSTLLDKIERRLGTAPLNLPKSVNKDQWGKVIEQDTLDTFSRFFPHHMVIRLDITKKTDDGYYYIDEDIAENVDILGVRDIDWEKYSQSSLNYQQTAGYGVYDFLNTNYTLDDIAMAQMYADHISLFNNGIYVEMEYPNKIKITNATGGDLSRLCSNGFPVELLIKHSPNLMTISPTQMETFEGLATADVATFLYQYLKNYDGLETVFANIDLKLASLESAADKRADIVNRLEEGYVSAANKHQPMMFTVG